MWYISSSDGKVNINKHTVRIALQYMSPSGPNECSSSKHSAFVSHIQ